MGNRVYLELRGCNSPVPGQEDEEFVASLAANNSLPMFWLALLREENIHGAWESEVRDAYAEPYESGIEPIRLDWREAQANLAAARAAAELRLPGLFPQLQAWENGLVALSRQGPAQEIRLYLAEHANFYDSADGFTGRLREIVRFWHDVAPSAPPPVGDAGSDLTGFVWLTGEPFPAAFPSWEPGRPVPEASVPEAGMPASAPMRPVGRIAEWGMVVLFSVSVLGAAAFGGKHLGPGGTWVGGAGGLLVAVVLVWLWARWLTSR